MLKINLSKCTFKNTIMKVAIQKKKKNEITKSSHNHVSAVHRRGRREQFITAAMLQEPFESDINNIMTVFVKLCRKLR